VSEAEKHLWAQLFARLDGQDKRLEQIATEMTACKASCGKIADLGRDVSEVREAQTASAKWHECHEADHGLGERPPRITVANLLGYGLHYPGRVAMLMASMVSVPAALSLALVLLVGPGGGLRILLQQAGIRAVYVPPPASTAPLVTVPATGPQP
jgi:hypothetical protein